VFAFWGVAGLQRPEKVVEQGPTSCGDGFGVEDAAAAEEEEQLSGAMTGEKQSCRSSFKPKFLGRGGGYSFDPQTYV